MKHNKWNKKKKKYSKYFKKDYLYSYFNILTFKMVNIISTDNTFKMVR